METGPPAPDRAGDVGVGPADDGVPPKAGRFTERAVLVSGDAHLTSLAGRFPVRTAAEFLAQVDS